MTLKLKEGAVLIGPGGNPTEDDACCCGEGCDPCAFRVNLDDLDEFVCALCDVPTVLPAWNGNLCFRGIGPFGNGVYTAQTGVGPDFSLGPYSMQNAALTEIAAGTWRLLINCTRAPGQHPIWFGDFVNATPGGIYTRDAGSCSAGPATILIEEC